MKKCAYSLILLLALVMVACSDASNKGNKSNKENVTDNKESILFATTDTISKFVMDTLVSNSPYFEVDISLPFAQGEGEAKSNINTAIIYAAFGIEGTSTEETISKVLETAQDEYYALRPDYINEKSMNQSPAWFNYRFSVKGNNSTGYNECINYTIENYSYTGGAHGLVNHILLNFDSKSGKEIKLQDFFAENYEEPLTKLLFEALGKQLGVTNAEEINEKGYFNIEELYPTENFLLAPDSIIFVYNSYEIAPYSMGSTRIALGYDQIDNIIKK